jgi:O-antigen/teichoic acid export membrane protein
MDKKFLKDTIFIMASRGFIFLFSFFINILIAQFTGPEGRGIYSLLSISILLLSLFFSMGMEEAYPFYIAKGEIKKEDLISILFYYLLIFVIPLLIIFSFLINNFKIKILPSLDTLSINLIIWGSIFHLSARVISSSFLGFQNYSLYGFSLFSYQLFGFIIILIFAILKILTPKNLSYIPFLSSILYFLIFFIIILNISNQKYNLNKRIYKKILNYGIPAQIGVILNFFNLRLDFYLVNFFKGVKDLGIYSISTFMAELLYFFPYGIGRVWFPKVPSYEKSKGKKETLKFLSISFIISLFLVFILVIFGKGFLKIFFGEKFLPSYIPFLFLIPGGICLGLTHIIASFLHGIGKPLFGMMISLVSIIFTISLDLILIPKYGIIGASIASSISYFIAFLTSLYLFLKGK